MRYINDDAVFLDQTEEFCTTTNCRREVLFDCESSDNDDLL